MKRALNVADPPLISTNVADSRMPSPGGGAAGCDEPHVPLATPPTWPRHSVDFKPISRDNPRSDLDCMITWSRNRGKPLPFPISGGCNQHPFDGHVIHHGGRMVPGAYCSRHAVTVCRSVPAWRDGGCTSGSRHNYTAVSSRRDDVGSAAAARMASAADEELRQRDLWELCERYGLADCSVAEGVPRSVSRAGYPHHTAVDHLGPPLVGVERLDLVDGVIDRDDDLSRDDNIQLKSMSAAKTNIAGCQTWRSNSRHVTPSHTLTGSRHRHPSFQTDFLPVDRSRSMMSTFSGTAGGRDVMSLPKDNCDRDPALAEMTADDQANRENDNCLMPPPPPPVNAVWKPPRERSPYYFKLDADASVPADRLPLVSVHTMTSECNQTESNTASAVK
jgi:hypothetical protein